jgi:hypothetical protein
MRVTMFWHGGSNYACFDTHNPKDAEEFNSIGEARRVFESRADFDPYYPCVESPEAWLCKGSAKSNLGAEYPDYVLSIGPRGGVHCSRG